MDDIANLLQGRSAHSEPPQLLAIKQYVKDNHKMVVQVSITTLGYSITVPNGSMATTLRMEQPVLRATCHIEPNKKIFIRIGHLSA